MPSGRPGLIRRVFGGLFAALDLTRRLVLNLLFLLVLAIVVYAWIGERQQPLQSDTALVLAIRGDIVEGSSAVLMNDVVARVSGEEQRETRLRDILQALQAAQTDAQIARVVLLTDEMTGAGPAVLADVAAALMRVRAAGKQVVAWGASFDQRQYFLAAHADEIYLHPMGGVFLRGFGGWRGYYRDTLERFGITAHVIRAGTYKAAGEQFALAAPSKEALEADTALYTDLWTRYTEGVEKARSLALGSVGRLIDELPQRLAAVQGDHAQLAIAEKLVDGVKTRDELRDLLIERGARDEAHATFRQIHFHGYLARVTEPHRAGAIGVVLVEGEITDEEGRPGSVGGKQVAERIRRARRDDDIKALVLRVDSPGGSPYGSELIRRELELTRAAGKPVVVSMGDVAASGGYWVAMAADEVVADPSTITGSIGVIALIPTADKAMEKLAARTGGVSTTWLAGAYDIRRPLDKRFAEIVQMGVDHTYRQFTALAAASRRRGLEDIDAVAQGRVWSGYQAKQHGLVDTLGGLTDALRSAAQRAKLGEDYAVTYLEREPTRFDWLLSLLAVKVAALGGTDAARLMLALDRMPGVAATEQELSWLMQAAGADAGRPLAHCLCAVP